jgi:hypothetical protein
LRELGFDVAEVEPNAHGAYNAPIRRLVSFERAMEARQSARG